MNTQNQFLGQLEKEVMEVVWSNKEPVTVRFVFNAIGKRRKIAYTTVMTIMGRLVKKKFLKTTGQGKAYTYLATYSKDKFLTKVSRQIINNLVSGFGDTAIAHFAQEIEKVPLEKREKLLKILKESDDN